MHLRHPSNPDQRSMRVLVVAIPDGLIRHRGIVAETVKDELHGRRRVGDEHDVKLVGIRVKESKHALANLVDSTTC